MPTYGYECTACNDQFEIVQSIKDDALTTCESCGGALRKKIYPVGIAFKGTGFYVNDYAAKPAGSSSSSSESAKPAESKADASKTETKSESPKSEAPKAETPKVESKPDPKPAAATTT
jgi:putative FmdB family regulatory protein